MKKALSHILSIIILLTLLTSCSGKPGSDISESDIATSDSVVTTSDYINWDEPISIKTSQADDSSERFADNGNGQFQVIPSDEIKLDASKLNIAGNYNVLTSSAMVQGAAVSNLQAKFTTFWSDEIVVKILAGDSDVDIYLLDASSIISLIDRGIYYPINSDIIGSYNNGCFDYLAEAVTDGKGQTVAMPLSVSNVFIAYPIQAANELGFDENDIAYYDDFHNLVNSYNGSRKSYASGDTLVSFYELQYEEYYCGFKNKVFDYETDLYKDIYRLYEGWQRYGQAPVMIGFSHPSILGTDRNAILDNENTLFTTVSSFQNFISASTPDLLANEVKFHISDWRAVHIPWISEDVNTNFTNATYAFINPYSKKYDESVRFLEYIAQNYFNSINSYTFVRKDKNEYPDSYQKNTQLFDDVYEISKNGFVSDYQLLSTRNDIDDFQNGRVTLDEAIAMYQREVDIWLNE